MNNSKPGDSAEGNGSPLAGIIRAADAGDPVAQLRLGEYYSAENGRHDSVSAYVWYMLASASAAPVFAQIEEGKASLRRSLTTEQIAEAESRVAHWLKNAAQAVHIRRSRHPAQENTDRRRLRSPSNSCTMGFIPFATD